MVVDHGMVYRMEIISISKFKATCLARLDRVKRTRQPLLITRKGEPIAEVQPPSPSHTAKRWLGSLAATGRIQGDIVAPAVAGDEWEALRQ